MSHRTEQRIATKMSSLGVPSSVTFYQHQKGDYEKYILGQNEHDCVTCLKHKTGKTPNNKRCKAICNKQHGLEVKTH